MSTTTHRSDPTPPSLARRVGALLREPRRIPGAVRRRLGPGSTGARPAAPPGVVINPRARRLEILTELVDLGGLGLEIGPSHNPLLPKSSGYDIRIADYLDRDGLLRKYEGLRPTERIEEVDYVLTGGRLPDEIADRFDYIVASHVVEHTVDLVAFLQDCAALLRPGGVLALAVPDNRYCFDRFRERTAIGRVIDVHRSGATVHSEGTVVEHNLNLVRKAGYAAWSEGLTGPYTYSYTLPQVTERAALAATGEYVDTHNWVFTPHHFRLLLEDLHRLGLVPMRERAFHDTVGPEFYVSLAVDGAGPPLTREQLTAASAHELGSREEITFVETSR